MLYSRANRVGVCVQDLVHVVRDAGAASFPPCHGPEVLRICQSFDSGCGEQCLSALPSIHATQRPKPSVALSLSQPK
jgi:hypothetical protein